MPKQIWKIDNFHGGLNTNANSRDILDNQLADCKDIMVDEVGKVTRMGGVSAHDSNVATGSHAGDITAGYGLHLWNHDRLNGHTGGSAVSATNDAETGENYLALSDSDGTGTVMIYANSDDTWGSPITGLTDVTGGNRKDVFYSVDGALRVCDSVFTHGNSSKWYGYIDRVLFKSIPETVTTDQWYLSPQFISAPDTNTQFAKAIALVEFTDGDYIVSSTISADSHEFTEDYLFDNGTSGDGSTLNMMGGIEVVVRITTSTFSDIPDVDDFIVEFDLTTGSANLDTDSFLGDLGVSHKKVSKTEFGVASSGATLDITYNFSFGDKYQGGGTLGDDFANGVTTYGIRTLVNNKSLGPKIASVQLKTVKVTESVVTNTNAHSELTSSNVHLEVGYSAPSTSGDTALGWDKIWEYGVSFIWDEKQESLIRKLFDGTDSDTTEHDNSSQSTYCPTAKMYIKHGNDSGFNRRITGAVWYIREASGEGAASEWTAQVEYDFVKGISKVLSTGKEIDCSFNAYAEEYIFEVDNDNLLSPNLVDTYSSRTGVMNGEDSIKAKFKTSCRAGRRVYIGNVQIQKEDGSKELKSDAMIKSVVNKFDIFPSKNIIEASINDGESIVNIEEFADRILQFKEQTLYIINTSQDIEFLEDVHKFKGVKHPCSVCKTDYGIAWANRNGCYFYDGRNVTNLLEKGGQKIISDDTWQSHVEASSIPVVGYIPNKRQIIFKKDANSDSDGGNIYLYDIVTKSWVFGDSKITDSQISTNFVNDWDGDLVYAHTSGTATLNKWDSSPDQTTNFQLTTKDIDFGRPGARKKIYAVYVNYSVNSSSGSQVQVKYRTNGSSDEYNFTGRTNTFDEGGTTLDDFVDQDDDTSELIQTSGAQKIASMKPSNPSEANNINSFQLNFYADTGQNVDETFTINDIHIVYRVKSTK